ncbi:MAG: glycerophosphodiester phosphodiesterase [Betaproteobacteria bacterium]|nr:glycerophosphodiester phosphodiesterase [Betaproteobacteria bacterium]
MLTKTRWPYPRIIAHRGAGVMAPENTLSALRVAASLGFAGVEVDARLAACGTVVLIHDGTVDRTTDASGAVSDFGAAELAAMDAGVWFGNEFAGQPVPTLEQGAALGQQFGLWMNVEIKTDPDADARDAGAAIAAEVARRWGAASPPPLLSSFSEDALAGARVAAPDLPRGLLVDALPHDWLDRAQALGCSSLHVRHDALSAAIVTAVREAGLGLLAFTVNEPGRAITLFEWGVDAIVTDELREIRADFLSLYGIG